MALDKTKFNRIGGEESELNIDEFFPAKDKPLKTGDSVEGRKLGKREKFGKNESTVWVLDVDGKHIGVWGSTVIDARMTEIANGKMVGVEYLGERVSQKTGKEYHDFYVGEGIDVVGDED